MAHAQTPDWMVASNRRDLNYSLQAVRDWYGEQIAHFIDDGIDFWWNDEGETTYPTYAYWNMAERAIQESKKPNKRFWSINRAWMPGNQRIGAQVWTGDIGSDWGHIANSPGYLLNWGLAGVPYIANDIGGFAGDRSGPSVKPGYPELLVRWMNLGVFLPVMRVHSTFGDVPHFPWLFGDDAA